MLPNPASRIFFVLASLLFVSSLSLAQQPTNPEPAGSGDDAVPRKMSAPTITFTRDWPKGEPPYYRMTVHSDGSAEYLSHETPLATEADPNDSTNPPYSTGFSLTPASTQKIFSLAEQANFFNGNFNYDRHRVADTGNKTLAYSDSARHFQTSYNWSENNAIDDLTHLFEGIALTIESGEQLRHLMRFDKLGLNSQLTGMEEAASSGQMREIQLIAPILNQIASDSAYMHIAQQRARHLLSLASK